MILKILFKLWFMSLIGTGLQLTSWIYWGVDWLLDLVARYLFGPWCLVCAYIWIIIFKILLSPVLLLGAIWHIFLEIMTFPVYGWMLFFKGQGCFF